MRTQVPRPPRLERFEEQGLLVWPPLGAHRLGTLTAIQFAKFLAVGALNTAFGYGVFALLILAGVPPMPSLVITYVVGITFNFVTTGRLVFDHGHPSALVRFVAAYVAVFLANAGLYKVLSASGLSPLLAQGICVPIMAVLAFVLFKFHVFNPRANRA